MVQEVIGTLPATGEVLVRDTATGDMYWQPGTPAQITAVTEAVLAAGDYGVPTYPSYEPPAAIPPPPTGTVFDSIINWIKQAISAITGTVTGWVSKIGSEIKETIATWVNFAVRTIIDWINSVLTWVKDARDWVISTYNLLQSWVKNAYSTVSSAVSNSIGLIKSWLQAQTSAILSWWADRWRELTAWFSSVLSVQSALVTARLGEINAVVRSFQETIMNTLTASYQTLTNNLTTIYQGVTRQLSSRFDWMATFITDQVVKPMNAWWDQFIGRILDFPSWVDRLFDAVAAWLTEDIPGSSPRWTGIFERIFRFLWSTFVEFPRWFFKDVPERVAYGLGESFKWVADTMEAVMTTWNEAILSFAKSVGPMSPEMAITNYSSITKLGMVALGGLTGMTIAGELLHPLKRLGLGNLAAMLFDATNYKLITGAFIGAFATAVFRYPLAYYFQSIFRPLLPDPRAQDQMYNRELITNQEYDQFLAYRGIPDSWHEKMRAITETAVGYFALAAVARTGIFNEGVFDRDLTRRGYPKEMRLLLIDMFRKSATESVKGVMLGAARNRFKEGLTTEDQFDSELILLRANPLEREMYKIAGRLDYVTDFTMDMVDAYTEAVRKGKLSLEEYRQGLLRLGMVPERVEARVIRERVRLKPAERPTPLTPPKAFYDTDQGKIKVDTIRRLRRKERISRDQEIAALLETGMTPDLATDIADNDDARLAEKGGEE